VDDSDPDLEEPQIQHLLQTAEAIRLDHPRDDWFHLVGLVHGNLRPRHLFVLCQMEYCVVLGL
jgi:hypothetical protein